MNFVLEGIGRLNVPSASFSRLYGPSAGTSSKYKGYGSELAR